MEENNKAPDLFKLCKELINTAYNLIKKNIESSDGLESNVDRVARSMVSVKGRHINEHLRTALGVNDRVIARAWQRVMEDAIALDKEIEADPDNQIVRTGVSLSDAQCILPNALRTSMITTLNFRERMNTLASSIKNNYVSKKELGDLAKHYSYIIDFSKSDPASMITYADDSDAAAMSTDWFNVLGLKLCVLKEGKVLYYLNPDNVTKQINGSPADITTLGNDVMLEVPRMGTNCMWLDGNRLKITITTAPNRAGYDYRAFSLHKYNDCDKIYIGRYHACLNNNKMYSSSGKTPMVSQTLAQHRTYATNRGTGYTDIGICDNILLQCLYLLIVKNFNSQSAVGRGIVDTDAKHNTGEANTFGWLNGGSSNRTDGNTAVCCLGLENWWGNIWVWEDGIIKTPVSGNVSQQTITMAQYADQYNSNGSGYKSIGTFPYTLIDTVNNGRQRGYQGRVAGVPEFIFLPNSSTVSASGRSESTYMCDWHHIELSAITVSLFGGSWCFGSRAGAFRRHLDCAPSAANDHVGSRLVYKKVAES